MTDKQHCLQVLRILLKNTNDWSRQSSYIVMHGPSGLALAYRANNRPFSVHVLANHGEKWTLGIWNCIPLQWGIFKLKRRWRVNPTP